MRISLPRVKSLRWSTHRTMWAYFFVLPTFLYFTFGDLWMMFTSFGYSFQKYNLIGTAKTWVGLANYKRALTDPTFIQALINTLKFAAIRGPVVLVLSLLLALLLQNVKRAKGLFRMIYFLPFVTSGVSIAWVWKFIYVPNFGIVTPVLEALGFGRISILGDPRYALYGIIVVAIWSAVGYYGLVFLAGLEEIPVVFYEAAEIDGANSWQKLLNITVPLLNRTVVLTAILLIISSLKTFNIVRMMGASGTGGPLGSTRTLPLLIYMTGFGSMHMGRASAIAVLFFFIVLVVTVVQRRLLTKDFEY